MAGNPAATLFKGGRPQTPSLPGSNRVEKGDFVTHGDLLRLAQQRHCRGIHSEPVVALCHPEKNFWVFRATVFRSAKCRGFVGYGDAHPGNVSPLIFNNAEMRMAETRAVNRALRKAYGIGLCSLEELPPWRLSPAQIPVLRRTLQSRPPFQKGVTHANENPRPQSGHRKKAPGRRVVPSPGRALRTRRPRP
jgi:hypothetical protein